MYHPIGPRIVTSHSIPVCSMIFVLRVMLITMVEAVQISADHVTINLVTIHAHRLEASCAYPDGKETIAPKVSYSSMFFLFPL